MQQPPFIPVRSAGPPCVSCPSLDIRQCGTACAATATAAAATTATAAATTLLAQSYATAGATIRAATKSFSITSYSGYFALFFRQYFIKVTDRFLQCSFKAGLPFGLCLARVLADTTGPIAVTTFVGLFHTTDAAWQVITTAAVTAHAVVTAAHTAAAAGLAAAARATTTCRAAAEALHAATGTA